MTPFKPILALALTAGLPMADAQTTADNAASPVQVVAPPPPAAVQSPSNSVQSPPPDAVIVHRPKLSAAPPPPEAKPTLPPGPPAPMRSPAAILRVLDKVTAETMRFMAPVGQRVRYKTLVFVVKTCETRSAAEPLPRPSAYILITSEPLAAPGYPVPPAKLLYRGWMFANHPDLHALQHPVYDAWLESCAAAPAPPS